VKCIFLECDLDAGHWHFVCGWVGSDVAVGVGGGGWIVWLGCRESVVFSGWCQRIMFG
jgi:hypothetical protein